MQRIFKTSQSKSRQNRNQDLTRTQRTISDWNEKQKTLSSSRSSSRFQIQGKYNMDPKLNKDKGNFSEFSFKAESRSQPKPNNDSTPEDLYMMKMPKKNRHLISFKPLQYKKELQNIFIHELSRICDNSQQSDIEINEAALLFYEGNIIMMQSLFRLVKKIQQNIKNRSLVVDLTQSIIQVATQIKNTCLHMFVYYFLGRIILNYKNPVHAIVLFKQCNRLATSQTYFRLKMKCYMQLGKLFMNLRQNLSLLYLVKYLTLAWKLNDHVQELGAYDLLGKYYFYTGDIKTACIFHQKMVSGHKEPQNSLMKRLAIIKFDTQRRMKPKEDYYIKKTIEEPEFVVSSDEELFDVLSNETQQKNIENKKNLQSDTREQLLNYKIRDLPKFSGHNEEYRKSLVNNLANQNMRSTKVESKVKFNDKGQIDFQRLYITNIRQNFGEVKDKVCIQHLSPNRSLGMFQNLELTKDSKSYKRVKDLNIFFEPTELASIKKATQKLSNMLSAMIEYQEYNYFQIKGSKHDNKHEIQS